MKKRIATLKRSMSKETLKRFLKVSVLLWGLGITIYSIAIMVLLEFKLDSISNASPSFDFTLLPYIVTMLLVFAVTLYLLAWKVSLLDKSQFEGLMVQTDDEHFRFSMSRFWSLIPKRTLLSITVYITLIFAILSSAFFPLIQSVQDELSIVEQENIVDANREYALEMVMDLKEVMAFTEVVEGNGNNVTYDVSSVCSGVYCYEIIVKEDLGDHVVTFNRYLVSGVQQENFTITKFDNTTQEYKDF